MRRTVGLPVLLLAATCVAAACAGAEAPTAIESNQGGTTADTTSDTDPSTPTSQADDGTLGWGECDPDDVPESTGSVPGTTEPECTTLEVPLDHDDPDGEQIEVALIRVPASGVREGAILTNPGGPGGSGFDLVANGGSTIAAEMGGGESFDLVGFDPRGVDRSRGLDCVSDEFLDEHLSPDLSPDDAEERRLLDESEQGVYEACAAEYGDELRHYSTEATARDMDLIREAMGDEQLTYLGISYGTYLGAVYATLFPERVRAMVLDSAFEPTGDTIEQQYTTQLVGFEGAFDNWAEWCADDERCAFAADDAAAVGERWDELFAALDERPLRSDEGRTANQATMFNATIASMYSETSWADLAATLAQAEDGDASGILRLADGIAGREPDGTYQNIAEAGPTIRCASGLVQDTPDDAQALLAEIREVAPRFSLDTRLEDLQNLCELMLDEPVEAIVPSYDGEAPILVTGGANDPATPFRWAEELDALLGPSSVLVRFEGEGHGQLISSKCITDMEEATLVELDPPDEGSSCEPDPDIERPEWWDDVPTPEGITGPEPLPGLLSAFGLSSSLGYGEVYLTRSLTPEEVQAAYESELPADFDQLTEMEILPDVSAAYYTSPNDLIFLVLVVPPEAFENVELESAQGIVPDGQTAVLTLAIAQ